MLEGRRRAYPGEGRVMPVASSQIEGITIWCEKSPELAEVRHEARRTYFAADDPRPIHHWPVAGDADHPEEVDRPLSLIGPFSSSSSRQWRPRE